MTVFNRFQMTILGTESEWERHHALKCESNMPKERERELFENNPLTFPVSPF